MPTQIWTREQDKDRLVEVCDVGNLREHLEGILTGELASEGHIGKIKKRFAMGRKKYWKQQNEEGKVLSQEFPFVYVLNSLSYPRPQGIMLTPFDETIVTFHWKSNPIEGHHRVQLVGSDKDDFISRVFRTYYDTALLKLTEEHERDQHLLVYEHERVKKS